MDRRKTVITNVGPGLSETQNYRTMVHGKKNKVEGLNPDLRCLHPSWRTFLTTKSRDSLRPTILPMAGSLCLNLVSASVPENHTAAQMQIPSLLW